MSAQLDTFRCNICGQYSSVHREELDREVASCRTCGSTVRWRSIVHILSVELFGTSLALPDFPHRPDIVGIGMSDWEGYAEPLARCFSYTNTFYHREPHLDITDVPSHMLGTLDFLISSDVFEHVPCPVSVAFANARNLLKPTGVLVFTVPYRTEGSTVEHFPDLCDYEVLESEGRFILHNRLPDGRVQVFDDLVFHGGPGSTLEMRVFSKSSLIDEFQNAGFGALKIYGDPHLAHGVYWPDEWSLPIAARACDARPVAGDA
jgi:hypothetical protein